MNKPLLSITRVNLKGVEAELRRIADALEAYLSVVHNYNLRPPQPIASNGNVEDASVEYSDDQKSAILEVIDDMAAVGIISKPKSTPEEEEDA